MASQPRSLGEAPCPSPESRLQKEMWSAVHSHLMGWTNPHCVLRIHMPTAKYSAKPEKIKKKSQEKKPQPPEPADDDGASFAGSSDSGGGFEESSLSPSLPPPPPELESPFAQN